VGHLYNQACYVIKSLQKIPHKIKNIQDIFKWIPRIIYLLNAVGFISLSVSVFMFY
jgi:hypothetical protein